SSFSSFPSPSFAAAASTIPLRSPPPRRSPHQHQRNLFSPPKHLLNPTLLLRFEKIPAPGLIPTLPPLFPVPTRQPTMNSPPPSPTRAPQWTNSNFPHLPRRKISRHLIHSTDLTTTTAPLHSLPTICGISPTHLTTNADSTWNNFSPSPLPIPLRAILLRESS